MKDLADTTSQLSQLTAGLMAESTSMTPEEGVSFIDQWVPSLEQGENTRPIAQELVQLKTLLLASPVEEDEVVKKMDILAGLLVELAPQTGAEGEMPSLLTALATALRMAGSKEDGSVS